MSRSCDKTTVELPFSPSSKTDFDCEAVIIIGDFLYLFSKDGIDLRTRRYKIPDKPGTYTVSPISSLTVPVPPSFMLLSNL